MQQGAGNCPGKEPKMPPSDFIYCNSAEDVKRVLEELGAQGINAVVFDAVRHIIKMTQTPEERDGAQQRQDQREDTASEEV